MSNRHEFDYSCIIAYVLKNVYYLFSIFCLYKEVVIKAKSFLKDANIWIVSDAKGQRLAYFTKWMSICIIVKTVVGCSLFLKKIIRSVF